MKDPLFIVDKWKHFELNTSDWWSCGEICRNFGVYPTPNFLGVDYKNFETYIICRYLKRNLYANFVAIREGTAEHYCVHFGSTRIFPRFHVYFQSPIFLQGSQSP